MVYKVGDKPGPGRGHKKAHPIDDLDFWKSTEVMIKEVMKSKDEAARLKGIALYLKWQTLKAKSDAEGQAGPTVDPGIMSLLGDQVESLLGGDYTDVDDLEDEDEV